MRRAGRLVKHVLDMSLHEVLLKSHESAMDHLDLLGADAEPEQVHAPRERGGIGERSSVDAVITIWSRVRSFTSVW